MNPGEDVVRSNHVLVSRCPSLRGPELHLEKWSPKALGALVLIGLVVVVAYWHVIVTALCILGVYTLATGRWRGSPGESPGGDAWRTGGRTLIQAYTR